MFACETWLLQSLGPRQNGTVLKDAASGTSTDVKIKIVTKFSGGRLPFRSLPDDGGMVTSTVFFGLPDDIFVPYPLGSWI